MALQAYKHELFQFFAKHGQFPDINKANWAKFQELSLRMEQHDFDALVNGPEPCYLEGILLGIEGSTIKRREGKKKERVLAKWTTDPAFTAPKFKPIADLDAYWITCKVEDIEKIWNRIHKGLEDCKAIGNPKTAPVYWWDDQPFKGDEICARMYVYDPDTNGTVVEIWIGHPLSKYTFTVNSVRREIENGKKLIPKPEEAYDWAKKDILEVYQRKKYKETASSYLITFVWFFGAGTLCANILVFAFDTAKHYVENR